LLHLDCYSTLIRHSCEEVGVGMPRLQHNSVIALKDGLAAFLRLDAGIGRRVPPDPGDSLKTHVQQIQNLQHKQKPEEQRRRRAENKLERYEKKAALFSNRDKVRALPEPDSSLERQRMFKAMISPLRPGKMLDLATGHGKFALVAAKLGWEVIAVDARTVRFPNPDEESDPKRAQLIKSIKWIESDLREFSIGRNEYDLVSIFGVLHHLEIKDQIKLLKRCSNMLTILDTRIAPTAEVSEGTYNGQYYYEPGKSVEEQAAVASAAWGNKRSFRSTEESLLRMVRDCGYTTALNMRPPHDEDYTFYVCLP
jgi:2-polyprenyl-3-methyl-5-hydroxy-6-metoxy-1,4-benzoquinol methylase